MLNYTEKIPGGYHQAQENIGNEMARKYAVKILDEIIKLDEDLKRLETQFLEIVRYYNKNMNLLN